VNFKVTQYVPPHHDVIDEAFEREFEGVRFKKVSSAAELERELLESEVLIANNPFYTPEISAAVERSRKQLKWIQFTTVGIDTAARSGLPNDIPITNVRGIRTGILAGHAMALMLAQMRALYRFSENRLKQEWARSEICKYVATTEDKVIVIVGLGEIGRDIARKAKSFDMRVVGISRAATPDEYIDEVYPRTALHDVLPRADVLMLSLPLEPDTHHLIGAHELSLMKRTSIVVNIARGPIIDEAALAKSLLNDEIAGAAMDVTEIEPLPHDSPLWNLKNVVISPHVGGQGDEAQKLRLRRLISDNLSRYMNAKPLHNVVSQKVDGWK